MLITSTDLEPSRYTYVPHISVWFREPKKDSIDHAMPWLTLPAAAEATPLRRPRRRQRCEPVAPHLSALRSTPLPRRDWAGLPPELISSIFHRLDPVQIMLGADKVCRSWRRAARDEPELWRRIDMCGYSDLARRKLADLDQIATDAVLRSQGQCQAFTAERTTLSVTDGFLRFLGNQAPALKCLILVHFYEVSEEGFMEAIQMFPQLEELELSQCWTGHEGLFEVAKACPHLKHLRRNHLGYIYCFCCPKPCGNDKEAMAIATMHGIRSLQLTHDNLTNQGLVAILDNCPHIESLEILKCCNIIIDDALRAKCAHIKSLKLVPTSENYYNDDFEPTPTISECSVCRNYFQKSTRQGDEKDWITTTNSNDEEHIVTNIVRALRSHELYHNDLTSQGLAAILEKLPHLESSDICNCRNIIMRNTTIMRNLIDIQNPYSRVVNIKTKKLTIKLLRGEFYYTKIDEFPCLTCSLSDINMNYAFGSNYTVPKEKMKNCCQMPSKQVKEFECQELDPCLPILECSTCLMFQYFAKRWQELKLDCSEYDDPCYDIDGHGEIDFQVDEYFAKSIEELDLDDYSDYDDPSYGIDSHDIIDLHVDDRMVGKRLRRYLKMEWK
ncbi:unnamed protein product [Urochloa decumbens]|uniref:F-box domain-containing protein n=1 Tax=Urochloa decumbens TaxID=240449 RepID=A0ABC9FQD7_9POAL